MALTLSSCATIGWIKSIENAKKMVPVETESVRVGVYRGQVIAYLKGEDLSAWIFFLDRRSYPINFLIGIKNTSELAVIETRLSHFKLSYIEPEKKSYKYSFYEPKNESGQTTTINCFYENEYLVPFIKSGNYWAGYIMGIRDILADRYYKNHDLRPGESNAGVIAFDFSHNPVDNITLHLKLNGKDYDIDFKMAPENWFPEKIVLLDDYIMDYFPENIDDYIIEIKQ
jgi:hypothetical protein